jgi:hypothetical protein
MTFNFFKDWNNQYHQHHLGENGRRRKDMGIDSRIGRFVWNWLENHVPYMLVEFLNICQIKEDTIYIHIGEKGST